MNDDLTSINPPQFCDSPGDIHRRRSKEQNNRLKQSNSAKKQSCFLQLLWACFTTGENNSNKSKAKVRSKYESVLYIKPDSESNKAQQEDAQRKPDIVSGFSRSSGLINSNNDK